MNQISSPRLTLMPLDASRVQDLFEMDRDPEVMRFIKRPTPTLRDAEEKLNRYVNYAKTQSGLSAYTVLRKSDQKFLGLGFLVHIELNPANAVEVGYRLKKEFWGQGLATEIAEALLRFGFENLKLQEIYGTTDPQHVVSQKILKKVGLKYIGEATYHEGCTVFKITAHEFFQPRG